MLLVSVVSRCCTHVEPPEHSIFLGCTQEARRAECHVAGVLFNHQHADQLSSSRFQGTECSHERGWDLYVNLDRQHRSSCRVHQKTFGESYDKHANLIHPTSTARAEIDASSSSQISQDVETSVVFDVGDVQVKDMKAYTGLVVGAPTWNTGSDTMRSGTCWDDVLEDIRALDLKDKKVAVFGLGDSSHFSENFCDAIEEIHDTFATTGAEMIGYVAVKGTNDIHGYTFDHSEAVRDDKFLGLPLDEDNEFDYTEGRVKGWTKQLISEGLQ